MASLKSHVIKGSEKRYILYLCWATYSMAYLLRLNYSVAVPLMAASGIYTNSQLGAISGAYFFTYTCGQLLNGALGDHLDSRFFLVTGLGLSIICNIGCGISKNLLTLGICWTVNGFAQSMLWGPIVRTLSLWYEPESRGKVSFYMGFSVVAGYGAAWALASAVGEYNGWRSVFLAPVLPVCLMVFVLLITFQSKPKGKSEDKSSHSENWQTDQGAEAVPLRLYFQKTRIPLLFLIALTFGVVREGISAWLPTLLRQSNILPENMAWQMLLLVPFTNLSGLLMIQKMIRYVHNDPAKVLIRVFPILGILVLCLCLSKSVVGWYPLIVMIVLMAVTQGLTPVFSSLLPFQMASWGHVSMTAGILDFSIYCGAALSSWMIGFLLDHCSWKQVFHFWLIMTALGIAAALYWAWKKTTE